MNIEQAITTAKPKEKSVNFTSVPLELPKIQFLKVDGSLSVDEYELYDGKVYVSKSNDWQRYGKIEAFGEKTTYYIKAYKGGRQGESVVDPYSPMSKPEDLSVFNNQRGHRMCEYMVVSKRLFDLYTNYLKTRQPQLVKQVERDVLNGDALT